MCFAAFEYQKAIKKCGMEVNDMRILQRLTAVAERCCGVEGFEKSADIAAGYCGLQKG
jgi:hypothetical protein